MHEAVALLINGLTSAFAGENDRDSMTAIARVSFMAFVGRVAVNEGGFETSDIVLPVLREARSAIASIRCEGTALNVRNEILSELERTISTLMPVGKP